MNDAVTAVPLDTATDVTVIPVPLTVTAVTPAMFVPLSVTGTVVPCVPEFGLIDDSVGALEVMLKPTVLLTPLAVVTLTFRLPVAAAGSMMKFAVTSVPLETTTELTVTPEPLTVSVVAPVT